MVTPQMNVCIPTIGLPQATLKVLLMMLEEEAVVGDITLYVNEPDAVPRVVPVLKHSTKAQMLSAKPRTLYPAWNRAIQNAKDQGVEYLAILNDDITFKVWDPMTQAVSILNAHPEIAVLGFNPWSALGKSFTYCRGSYRHRGVPGYAFVVRASVCPLVDEQFQWWGGDDDLFFQIEKAGHRLARADIEVDHISETSAVQRDWTAAAKESDRQLMERKWNDPW